MKDYDPESIRELVSQELERQLKEHKPATATNKKPETRDQKSVLAILTGCDVFLDEVLTQLSILGQQYPLSLVPTKGFQRILPLTELQKRLPAAEIFESIPSQEIDRFIRRHQAVLVPLLTRNTVAKVALGVADSLAPILILNSLLQDKPVLAVKEGVMKHEREGMGATWRLPEAAEPPAWSGVQTASAALQVGIPHRPPSVRIFGLYQAYLRTLEQWGMKFVSVDQLAEEAERALNPKAPPPKPVTASERARQLRQIITRDDLLELHRQGIKELHLQGNAIITDSAKEYAQDQSIRLIYDQSE